MLFYLFIASLWSPAGKGLAGLLALLCDVSCVLSLSHVVLSLVVSIPDLCLLPYFVAEDSQN